MRHAETIDFDPRHAALQGAGGAAYPAAHDRSTADIPPVPAPPGGSAEGDARYADGYAARVLARFRFDAGRLMAWLCDVGDRASGDLRSAGDRLWAATAARWRDRMNAGAHASGDGGRALAPYLAPHIERAWRLLSTSRPAVADQWLTVARRCPPGAAVAAGVGGATLMLAFLADDGGADFPNPAFERALQSQELAAMNSPTVDEPLRGGVLARELVEDPVFDPAPAADGRAHEAREMARRNVPSQGPASVGTTPGPDAQRGDGWASVAQSFAPAGSPPLAGSAAGVAEAQSRAEKVLAAATPVPPANRPSWGAGVDGPVAIQLVAVSRRAQAVDVWTRLHDANVDLFSDLRPLIVEPGAGVSALYRLRAGPFTSAEKAQARCAALGERRIDCIVVRNAG